MKNNSNKTERNKAAARTVARKEREKALAREKAKAQSLAASSETPKKEKEKFFKSEKAKSEFKGLICLGAIIVVITTICFLIFYQPFKRWKKFDFSVQSDVVMGFEHDGIYTAIYHYKIDGVEYHKKVDMVRNSLYDSHDDRHIIYILYINMDNPNEVKRANLGTPTLLVSIMFEITGCVLVWQAFRQRRAFKKEQEKLAKRKS